MVLDMMRQSRTAATTALVAVLTTVLTTAGALFVAGPAHATTAVFAATSQWPGVPTDFEAPTTPGDADIVFVPGVTLVWQPSTDNRGVVAYEVYESNRLLATVTGTSYVYSTSNAIPPRLYLFAVRAVDAAGNVSPYAHLPLGPTFPAVPPSAPAWLAVTSGRWVLTVTWEPVPARLFLDSPISGYEVYVDGALAGRVGGSTLRMPTPAPGAHTFGVRAFNAAGLYSPLAETQHVVRAARAAPGPASVR